MQAPASIGTSLWAPSSLRTAQSHEGIPEPSGSPMMGKSKWTFYFATVKYIGSISWWSQWRTIKNSEANWVCWRQGSAHRKCRLLLQVTVMPSFANKKFAQFRFAENDSSMFGHWSLYCATNIRYYYNDCLIKSNIIPCNIIYIITLIL